MKTRILGLISFGLMAILATDAKANFVVNGEFEVPNVGGTGFQNFGVGSTAITGWTVASGVNNPGQGSVDLVSNSFFPSTDGVGQSVDLDGTYGNPAGGLTQTLVGLTAGYFYTLQFFYANNPAGLSSSALVSVGSLTTGITHSGSNGNSLAGMNYTTGTYTFAATGSTQLLSFLSTDPAADLNGIVLDNVSVNFAAIPEPASCAMLGLGLLAVGAYTRARRRTA
jgi:hypothetical protein